MAKLVLPASLRSMVDADSAFGGETLGLALQHLVEEAPRLRPYLFDGAKLRPFVVVFQNGKDVSRLQGLETPLANSDVIRIVASVAGG